MNVPVFLAAAAVNANKAELLYVWEQATPEAKAIIFCLVIFSIIAWSVMISKALQMRRAKRLNRSGDIEYGVSQQERSSASEEFMDFRAPRLFR